MKKANRILSILLVVAMTLLALVSCAGGIVASTGTAKIVVEKAEGDYSVYEVDLSKLERRDEGAISLLEYIASLEGSTLYYNVQWGGGYGAYITSIDTLNPNPANQYIAIYTTEEEDFAVPTEWTPTVPTVEYGDMTLTYTGVGLSSMHVKDGTVILFRLEGF
ncbi:MAG: aminoacyl-histidine dipeptidase [Ruminococcaceae bacterium]|nr:aminoacyl-histidine dipeptidase [Oscillospiraceae bacterium]